MRRKAGWQGIFLVAIALGSIALDQFTKHLVRTHIPLYTSWNPIEWLEPIVTLTHIQNTGVAFGMFQNMGRVFVIVPFVVIAAIIFYYRQIASYSWLLTIAFGFMLGGATGNLIDRLTQDGIVTDFIDFRVWPVFNVADMSIVVGALLLSYYGMFLDRQREDEPEMVKSSQTEAEAS